MKILLLSLCLIITISFIGCIETTKSQIEKNQKMIEGVESRLDSIDFQLKIIDEKISQLQYEKREI